MPDQRIDRLGFFLMSRLRDRGIDFVDRLSRSEWRSPKFDELQRKVAELPPREAALVRAVTIEALDTALHDFLFALGEASDLGTGIELTVDGVNAATISDGLHGELSGPDGWRARLSRFGGPASDL